MMSEENPQFFSHHPLSPQLKEWALAQHTKEEVVAALREAREEGTFELKDFVEDLEKVVEDHKRAVVPFTRPPYRSAP